jgi:Fic family protein
MYTPIENLPVDMTGLATPELDALATVWRERKSSLEETGEYKEFVKRLQREWAIETGLIERLYTWDRGVTEVLIHQGISDTLIASRGGLEGKRAKHAADLIHDQLDVAEGLFGVVKGQEPLTEAFIRELQARFTAHQEEIEAQTPGGETVWVQLAKGEYKTLPNNPKRPDGKLHEYCPPHAVKGEMERLLDGYRSAVQAAPCVALAAWLHHRFTQIHPFQDGNGRVARALASLVFLRAGLFPLVVRDADREDYIGALEAADADDLGPLTKYFARCQKDAILRALGIEQEAKKAVLADEVIRSALKALKARSGEPQADLARLTETADNLCEAAYQRMSELSDSLGSQLTSLSPLGTSPPFRANARLSKHGEVRSHWFKGQVIEVARTLEYFANFPVYSSWARLVISTQTLFEIVVSLHGYGSERSGVIVASALSFQRLPNDEDKSDVVDVRPVCPELFQFNYAEPTASVKERFSQWLETSLAVGLTEWKRSIEA